MLFKPGEVICPLPLHKLERSSEEGFEMKFFKPSVLEEISGEYEARSFPVAILDMGNWSPKEFGNFFGE